MNGTTATGAFAHAVALRDDAPAVLLAGREVSYRELDELSNAVAHLLLDRAADRNAPVGICTPHPLDFLAGIVGVIKAGHIYLPVDPAWPAERIRHVARASGMRLLAARAPSPAQDVSDLLEILDLAAAHDTGPVAAEPQPHAYVVFTSGSSGMPKGVLRTHVNLVEGMRWNSAALGMGPGDRVAWLSSPGTAVATAEAFDALLSGATLCPVGTAGRALQEIAEDLAVRRVDILRTVPSMFRHLASAAEARLRASAIRMVRLGGEPVFRNDLELFRRAFPAGAKLQVAMASSEAGPVCAMTFDHDWAGGSDLLPVGRWPGDGQMRIVREDGSDAKSGEAGELVVRGPRVMPGFWSAEGILPVEREDGVAVHRTGDLLRRGEDGFLYFAGRRDAMLKVRGHRVDPIEIEARLAASGMVKEAAVVGAADAGGDMRLHAFVTGADAVDVPALRACLGATLPAWMIPSHFEATGTLPRLPGGKVDRVALAARAASTGRATAAPEPEGQEPVERLRRLWRETLHVSHVDDADDFFEAGGDSLLAAHLAARVEKELGRPLLLSTLAANPTFGALAAALQDDPGTPYDILVPLRAEGDRVPVYLLTGEGGNVVRFLDLAHDLGPDQPVFAIQAHGLDGSGDVPRTIEEIAARNVERLLRHRPRGPYVLAGYSLGGTIAWEMARQFRAAGSEIPLLALIDAGARTTRAGLLRRMVAAAGRRIVRARGSWSRDRASDESTPASYARVLETNRTAYHRYTHGPYEGRVLLLRARWGARRSVREQDLGWSSLVRGPFEICDVPGDHHGCTGRPHSRTLAACLRERLDQVVP